MATSYLSPAQRDIRETLCSVHHRIEFVLKHQRRMQDDHVRDAINRMVEDLVDAFNLPDDVKSEDDVKAFFDIQADDDAHVKAFFDGIADDYPTEAEVREFFSTLDLSKIGR